MSNRLRRRTITWPKAFDDQLVKLWERSKEEDDKTPKSMEDFILGLAQAGYVMVESSLDQRKRGTSLVQPATSLDGLDELKRAYVGRR